MVSVINIVFLKLTTLLIWKLVHCQLVICFIMLSRAKLAWQESKVAEVSCRYWLQNASLSWALILVVVASLLCWRSFKLALSQFYALGTRTLCVEYEWPHEFFYFLFPLINWNISSFCSFVVTKLANQSESMEWRKDKKFVDNIFFSRIKLFNFNTKFVDLQILYICE